MPTRHDGPATGATCTVELYGVARLVARTAELELVIPPIATVAEVVAALADALPILVGRVITRDRARLVDGYACNLNGLQWVRTAETRVVAGDHLVILSADAGG